MKKFKDFLAAKDITQDAYEAKGATEKATLFKEWQEEVHKELETKISNMPDSEAVNKAVKEALEEAQKNMVTKDQLREVSMALEALKSNKVDEKKSFTKAVFDSIDDIKAIVKRTKEKVVVKADTVRGSIVPNNHTFNLPSIGQLGIKERSLYSVLPKINLGTGDHNGTIEYTDWNEATIVRAAAMVAEGGVFPESTASFAMYKKDLKKIGDSLPVSEEFGTDQVSAAAQLEQFVTTNVEVVIDNQILNGDGLGNNLSGLASSSPAYTAPNEGISVPTIKDLARRMRTAIVSKRGSKYRPDMVVMNSNTIDKIYLSKDSQGRPLFSDNETSIGSLAIVEDNNLPDNQLIIGDRRFATIWEMGGIELSRVMVNNQALEDMSTIKARKRLLLLVREADKTGFLKCTDIDAALTALAANPV